MWQPVGSKMVDVDELISRERVTRQGDAKIVVDARPAENGGVNIVYNGKAVAIGLNIMEAFVTLAGMMKNGQRNIQIKMSVVSEQFTDRYLAGYRATK